MRDKLAIVGAEARTRDNAPYDDLEYDIWSFSDWLTAPWLKRCDAIIEVHAPAVYRNHPRTPEYWNALQTTDTTIFMAPIVDPLIPSAVQYPLGAVLEMLGNSTNGGKPIKTFNCSLAYAMALGVLKEYQIIDVYGVELNINMGTYSKQSKDFAFWKGFAVGHGTTVNTNCSEGMFAHPLYGVEDTTPTSKLYEMMQSTVAQREQAQKTVDAANGALQIITELLKD